MLSSQNKSTWISSTVLATTAILSPVGTATLAEAGTWRADQDPFEYEVLAGLYPSVGKIDKAGCSGTLIGSRYVLTAGHCITGDNAITNLGSFSLKLERDNPIISAIIHPDWWENPKGLEGHDIALLALLNPSTVTPASLYSDSDIDIQEGTYVGFGWGGNGETGADINNFPFGTKRAGTNIFEFHDGLLFSDFDSHTSNEALNYEYSPTPGDSGAGVFINDGTNRIFGVHSGDDKTKTPPSNKGKYGVKSHNTSVSSNKSWMDSAINWFQNLFGNNKVNPLPEGVRKKYTGFFPDVSDNNTFKDFIYALAGDGVVKGFPDGLFRPEQNVTRGELAKFVVNGFGISPTSVIIPESGYFSDVPQNYGFSSYINTLKSEGIISGFEDGLFRPEQNVTRGELAKFIAKAGNYDPNKYGNTQFFPDVDSSNTFHSFINTLKGYEVINGFPDGTFKPDTPVTRGELAKFIVNGFDKAFVNNFTNNRGKIYLYGENQNNAITASSTQNDWKYFSNVPSGLWYDPLTTYGLRYEALGDTLFTNILNFPTGIAADNQFTVSVGNNILGNFSPGQSVDFTSLLGSGVSQFTVTIASLLANTNDVPFQLAFNNARGSFRMQEFTSDAPSEAVPEPSSILGSLLGLAFLVNHGRKKQKATVNSR